jgi:ribosome-interacting GTPase 1
MADLMRRADMLLVMLDLHADPLQQLEETLTVLQDLRIFPEGFSLPGDLKKPPFIKKTLMVMNKVDSDNQVGDYQAFLELVEVSLPSTGISVRAGWNLKGLLELLYRLSGVIRVYTKIPGKEPNRSAPFVLAKMTTLEELAGKIHKDFVNKLKFAKIWGSAVYDGQMVQRDYVLQDGDVVEIHL